MPPNLVPFTYFPDADLQTHTMQAHRDSRSLKTILPDPIQYQISNLPQVNQNCVLWAASSSQMHGPSADFLLASPLHPPTLLLPVYTERSGLGKGGLSFSFFLFFMRQGLM